jgi:undecaprenyl-diphosphatase
MLGLAAKGSGPLPGDLFFSRALQQALPYHPPVAEVWSGVGKVVEYLPYVLIGIALLLRQWGAALLLALAFIIMSFFFEARLKQLFARPRPAPDLVKVYQPSRGLSFPSGTALQTMAVIGLLIYLLSWTKRVGGLRTTARILTGLSILYLLLSNLARIHVGAHWLSDIFGGWLLSGAWVFLLIAGHQWWLNRNTE